MKIEIEVTDTQIGEVLCSGFEGGIGYWARIEKIHLGDSPVEPFENERAPKYLSAPLSPGGFVQLSVEEGGPRPKPLNREAIAWALIRMATEHPKHFAEVLGQQHDANTGDVLIQLAVFGEIVFC